MPQQKYFSKLLWKKKKIDLVEQHCFINSSVISNLQPETTFMKTMMKNCVISAIVVKVT